MNKQFEPPECVFDSVRVDLQYDISLNFTAGCVCLFVCLSVRLSCYPML